MKAPYKYDIVGSFYVMQKLKMQEVNLLEEYTQEELEK